MLSLILSLGIGAGVGAALGYFGQCASGTCPLTATWWRGAVFGALCGLLFHTSWSRDLAGSRELRRTDGPVQPVSEAGFESAVLQASTPVVVDFYATWCGPCKRLAPVLAEVAADYPGRVKFVKVDVDQARALAGRYQVSAVPTLMLFRAGKVEGVLAGALPARELRGRLNTWLGIDNAPAVQSR